MRGTVAGAIPPEEVTAVGFAASMEARAWLMRLPGDGVGRLLASEDGRSWHPLPHPPLRGVLAKAALGLHPAARRLSVVEPGWLHAGTVDGAWDSVTLPQGAVWASVGAEGVWWAAGSRSSTRVRRLDREVALWHRTGDGWTDVPIRTSWIDTYRTIRDGGFEELRTVDARHAPLVAASQCAWFLDDPSYFLFTARPDGRFAIQRLSGRMLARIERDPHGSPVAVTIDGELWDWDGRTWSPRGSAAALHRTLGDGPLTVYLTVADSEVYGVVMVRRVPPAPSRQGVYSDDGGASWKTVDLGGSPRQPIATWAR